MSDLFKGGALHVYGDSSYRHCVQDNVDAPGAVDLFYEEWSVDDEKRKVVGPVLECIPMETLVALAEGAKILSGWLDETPMPTEIVVTVRKSRTSE